MFKIKTLSVKNFMSVGNATQGIDFDRRDLTLVLGENLDLHDQGYINYCIECKYDVIIPVYDYRNWFQTSIDIQEMIKCLK